MKKFEIITKQTLESTNVYARELAKSGKRRVVIVALEQTSGKGRMKRKWYSPRGGLWFSVLLKGNYPEPQRLNILASLAVCRALKKAGLKAKLKWPNDVLVNGRKICGILSEASFANGLEYVMMGIGINCNFPVSKLPRELRKGATTTLEELGKPLELAVLLDSILKELDRLLTVLRNGGFSRIKSEWKKNSGIIGKEVYAIRSGKREKFIAMDLTDEGFLLVSKKGKKEIVTEGDIRIPL